MNKPKFRVVISPEAEDDIEEVFAYIAFYVMHPTTAEQFREGILETIDKLKKYVDIFAMSSNEFIRRRFGVDACTIRYKKMTIVYNIIGDVVYIRRVMPGSLIL